jgi:radical SAM protein with 4Fe4S-binding SPASM domain
VRLGHAPNCSSAGSLVGAALLSSVAAAVVINTLAHRLTRWLRRPPGGGEPAALRHDPDGGVLHFPGDGARLLLDAEGATLADSAAPTRVIPTPPDGPAPPGEVHVSVSGHCSLPCTGCYLDARPGPRPDPVTLDERRSLLRELRDLGVFEIALGGGEAGLGEDVLLLAEEARTLGLVPNFTTSGLQLTPAHARRLAGVAGQVNVSIDGLTSYAAVRGWGNAAPALRAVETLAAAGVRVGVNTALTKVNVGEIEALAQEISRRGAREWQWLRWKPAGRARDRYRELALTQAHALSLWPRALALERALPLQIRWDCAMVPFLAAHLPDPEPARLLGVRGCTGGEDLLARSPDGRWLPCSFASGGSTGEVKRAWREDAQLHAWRALAEAPPAPCRSCAWQSLCRGGCRIVAGHVVGDAMAPDPECPAVLRSRQEAA